MTRVAILTVSDRAHAGEREDASGPAVEEAVVMLPAEVVARWIVPDERAEISRAIRELARDADLVLTTGGTGVGLRDVTPEATEDIVERRIPGLGEEMRRRSLEVLKTAILSRATAGTLGRTLIVNLPGSPKGAADCFGFVRVAIRHALELLASESADCAQEDWQQGSDAHDPPLDAGKVENA